MLDKIKTSLNFFILIMFAVSIVYGVIVIIIDALNPDSSRRISITTENVDIYMAENNLVKTDYSTFYTLEGCIQSVITTLHDKGESKVYNILTNDVKEHINSNKNNLVQYYNKNFKYDVSPDLYIEGYQNSNNLKKVYRIDENSYICVITSMNESNFTKIGIRLFNNQTYEIFYIEV